MEAPEAKAEALKVGLSDAFEKIVGEFRFYNQFKENFLLVI